MHKYGRATSRDALRRYDDSDLEFGCGGRRKRPQHYRFNVRRRNEGRVRLVGVEPRFCGYGHAVGRLCQGHGHRGREAAFDRQHGSEDHERGDFRRVCPLSVGISSDGSTVAFASNATNLGASTNCQTFPGPFGSSTFCDGHVYVKDLATGVVTVADSSDSSIYANRSVGAGSISLSADGNLVAFASDATNLDPQGSDSASHVYVKNMASGDIVLASTDSAGALMFASAPRLSADGTTLVFYDGSSAHVKNLTTGALHSFPSTYGTYSSLSGDGSKVAFQTAESLIAADGDAFYDVYVADVAAGSLELAARTAAGVKGNSNSTGGQLDFDGDRVAFSSDALNLDPLVSAPCCTHTYLKELGGTIDADRDNDGVPDTADADGGAGTSPAGQNSAPTTREMAMSRRVRCFLARSRLSPMPTGPGRTRA